MVVGICTITLGIHGSNSLKDKRQVLKSVISRLRNLFNASVAEVADQDIWQKAVIGVSVVGTDTAFVNSCLDRIIDSIEEMRMVDVEGHDMEIMTY